jgi:glutathione S-transferase
MRELGIPFEEVLVRFDSFEDKSVFKTTMRRLYPAASVPVLEDKGVVIADTLAITEYLAEIFPDAGVWPAEAKSRYQARVLVAVMHSGFSDLRNHCPMNVEADLPEVGARLMREEEGLKRDLECLHDVLKPHLQGDEGFLFGAYSAADAFYAPIMSRLKTYQLPLPSSLEIYRDHILASSSMMAWTKDALAEEDFLDFEEPYRKSR